jgi:NAD-reducing hydrogenase large subunit
VDYQRYLDYIAEEVRPWSYMKFPFIKALWAGGRLVPRRPAGRLNTCDFIDTPRGRGRRKEFMALTKGKPNNITMAYHWARMIELLHSIEKIRSCWTTRPAGRRPGGHQGERREEAVGLIEAPRGTLFHHYRVDENDQVTMAT